LSNQERSASKQLAPRFRTRNRKPLYLTTNSAIG
jgi:hypothetical protein